MKKNNCEEIALKKIREMFEKGEGELSVKVWSRQKKDGTELEWSVKGGPTYRGKETEDVL